MQRQMIDFSIEDLPFKCAIEHFLNRPNVFSDFTFDAHFEQNPNLLISIRFTPQTMAEATIEVKPDLSSLKTFFENSVNNQGPQAWRDVTLHAYYSRFPFPI